MAGESDRQPGAWIGQRPDENTETVRESLDEGAERVAVTNNESDETSTRPDEPAGHREASERDR